MSETLYTIRGYFWRMLHRDEKTGNSLFAVKADDNVSSEYVNKYGCYTVSGYIPRYDAPYPLEITGKWYSDKAGVSMWAQTVKELDFNGVGTVKLLDALSCGLTHSESYEIVKTIGVGKLFDSVLNGSFVREANCKNTRAVILANEKMKAMMETRIVFEMLRPYRVPWASIEQMGSNALTQFWSRPFDVLLAHMPFEDADKVLRADFHMSPSTSERMHALMYDVVNVCENSGSTWVPFSAFSGRVRRVFGYSTEFAESSIVDAVSGIGGLTLVKGNGERGIAAVSTYLAEKQSAHLIKKMLEKASSLMTDEQVAEAIERNESELKIQYAPAQKESFNLLKKTGIAVLTGGPGVGKTTVINGLLRAYSAAFPKNNICLAAPTGRAAQRMAESTGRDAQTLHRTLGIYGTSGDYKTRNKLDADLIVIDESSMLDAALFALLLDSIKPTSLLLLVGDVDQLPSVGAGDVLHDCIKSGVMPVCKLNTVFRQGSQSPIVKNANKINSGDYDLEEDDLFMVFHCNDDEEVADEVVAHAVEWWDPGDPFSVQVLCPAHEGPGGDKSLNKILQRQFNPKNKDLAEVKYGSVTFRERDKVMFTSNNYDVGYLNGDLGIVKKISNGKMLVDVNGESIEVEHENYRDLSLAYCISIHKSQGSEFKNLILALPSHPAGMLKRNLLYTGITRAKQSCAIIETTGAIKLATSVVETGQRSTMLRTLLE